MFLDSINGWTDERFIIFCIKKKKKKKLTATA